MSHVDFYLLDNLDATNYQRHFCRLIATLYHNKHKVYIYCASLKEAQFYDELLWTFEEDSFVPHHLVDEKLSPPPPIQLGYFSQNPSITDVLFNLHDEIPPFYRQFKRIIEFVPAEPEKRELSRQHYRFYQEQALKVRTQQLTVSLVD